MTRSGFQSDEDVGENVVPTFERGNAIQFPAGDAARRSAGLIANSMCWPKSQYLDGDGLVDTPAVEEAYEVVYPGDLVVAEPDDDVLGFQSGGGGRAVRLDPRHHAPRRMRRPNALA